MKKMLALLLVLMLAAGCYMGVNHFVDNDNEDVIHTVQPTEPSGEQVIESAEVEETTEATLPTEVETTPLFVCEYDTRTYYYDQLSTPEQEIYNLIGESSDRFINNEKVCVVNLREDVDPELDYETMAKRALMAYQRDNPISSIWLADTGIMKDMLLIFTNEEMTEYVVEEGYYVVPYGTQPYRSNKAEYVENTPDEVYRMISEVEEEVKAFVQTLEGTDKGKLKKIHDWVVEGCEYSLDTPHIRDVYGCIIEKTCCCAGYADAMKYVADWAELNVIEVIGLAVDPASGETFEDVIKALEEEEKNPNINHAWNYVFTEEMGWTLVDPTWDKTYYLVGTGVYEDVYTPDGEYLGYFETTEETIIPNDNWLFIPLDSALATDSHIEYKEIGFKYPR